MPNRRGTKKKMSAIKIYRQDNIDVITDDEIIVTDPPKDPEGIMDRAFSALGHQIAILEVESSMRKLDPITGQQLMGFVNAVTRLGQLLLRWESNQILKEQMMSEDEIRSQLLRILTDDDGNDEGSEGKDN